MYTWYTRDVHVMYTWCTRSIRVMYTWCTRGAHVMYTWCIRGVYVMCTGRMATPYIKIAKLIENLVNVCPPLAYVCVCVCVCSVTALWLPLPRWPQKCHHWPDCREPCVTASWCVPCCPRASGPGTWWTGRMTHVLQQNILWGLLGLCFGLHNHACVNGCTEMTSLYRKWRIYSDRITSRTDNECLAWTQRALYLKTILYILDYYEGYMYMYVHIEH